MSDLLTIAAIDLLKREQPRLVAAPGLLFRKLSDNNARQYPLKDVLVSSIGGTWGQDAAPEYGYPVLRSTNMRGSYVDVTDAVWRDVPRVQAEAFTLETGDILVIKSSGSSDLVGKAALFVHPGDSKTYLFSNFTLRLRPNQDIILPEFLAWFLRSPQALIWRYEAQHTTVGLRNLKTKDFLSQTVPVPPLHIQKAVITYLNALEASDSSVLSLELPPPLDEQRRIVARTEELAALIEKARGLRVKAREEAEALLSSALASAYDEAVKIAGRVERLDDLCYQITDGTHTTPTYMSEGIPFLSVKDITTGTIRFDNTRLITPEEHTLLTQRCKPECDDVLLTKVGTTGFAKAIDVDREFSIFVSLALIKLDKTRLHPKFTEYMLNSPRLREYSSAGTRGVGNKNLVLKFIREFPMPAPSLSDQLRIVAYLDGLQAQVDELTTLQDATQAELDALLPSVLDRAFRGEL